MASHWFPTPHGDLHYTRRGLGDPVLLVHGLYVGASRQEYEHNVAELAKRHEVYALDLLGFGDSATPRMLHTAQTHAHLIRDFIAQEIGRQTHLVASGGSCGLAVRVAVYDDALLDKLVLLAPVPQPPAVSPPTPAGPAREEHGLGDWIAAVLMGHLTAGTALYRVLSEPAGVALFVEEQYADPRRVTRRQVEAISAMAKPAGMMAFASVATGYLDTDTLRWLRDVRLKTQVVWGDALGPPPTARVMRPAVWSRGKQIDVVPDAKAWPHVEQSAKTNALVRGFLEDDGG